MEKWECKFAREKRENREMRAFLKSHPINPPLDPREVFFGGRTENIITRYGYGENTLCGRVFSVFVRIENGYFSVRPTIYIGEQCFGVDWRSSEF